MAEPPLPVMISTVSCVFFGSRSVTTTCAPCAAAMMAIDLPIPLPLPVTITTSPSSICPGPTPAPNGPPLFWSWDESWETRADADDMFAMDGSL